ncbi:hypothetical protein ACJX0J_041884, partial [Zea mays]
EEDISGRRLQLLKAAKKLLHNVYELGDKFQREDTKMQDILGAMYDRISLCLTKENNFRSASTTNGILSLAFLSLVRDNKTKESFQYHEIRG